VLEVVERFKMQKRLRKIIPVILMVAIFIISSFYIRITQGWFMKAFNLFSMVYWKGQIKNGYFFDNNSHIKFKIPLDTYGCGFYGGGNSGHLDLAWYRDAKFYSDDYLAKIYWFKESGEVKDIIEKRMNFERDIAKRFGDIIEINELINTRYGLQGHLRYSESKITDEYFFFKDGFLVTVTYIANKNDFNKIKNNELLDFFDSFITTFSTF